MHTSAGNRPNNEQQVIRPRPMGGCPPHLPGRSIVGSGNGLGPPGMIQNQQAAGKKAKDNTRNQGRILGQMGKGSIHIPAETDEMLQI